MIEAILSIRGPDNWLIEVSREYPASISLINWRREDGGRGKELVRVNWNKREGDEDGMGNYDELFDAIKARPDVCDVKFTPTGNGSAVGVVTTKNCAVCSTLEGTNCFLMDASVNENWITWKLLTSDRENLMSVFERLKERGFEIELHRIRDLEEHSWLTDRQERILRTALLRGYFDYPKRISLKELASIFGISISTASEILRRGQKKILMDYFKLSDEEM